MFSEGHLLFIFISLVLIAGGNCRMSPGKKKNKARQYFIDLQRWRSLAALIACCDTFFFTVAAIVSTLIHYSRMGWTIRDYFRRI